jgi:hypothetical protein
MNFFFSWHDPIFEPCLISGSSSPTNGKMSGANRAPNRKAIAPFRTGMKVLPVSIWQQRYNQTKAPSLLIKIILNTRALQDKIANAQPLKSLKKHARSEQKNINIKDREGSLLNLPPARCPNVIRWGLFMVNNL